VRPHSGFKIQNSRNRIVPASRGALSRRNPDSRFKIQETEFSRLLEGHYHAAIQIQDSKFKKQQGGKSG
jgi:hypothetical protein